jgi:hypothetical protein
MATAYIDLSDNDHPIHANACVVVMITAAALIKKTTIWSALTLVVSS